MSHSVLNVLKLDIMFGLRVELFRTIDIRPRHQMISLPQLGHVGLAPCSAIIIFIPH
jgi:hypothetical protein